MFNVHMEEHNISFLAVVVSKRIFPFRSRGLLLNSSSRRRVAKGTALAGVVVTTTAGTADESSSSSVSSTISAITSSPESSDKTWRIEIALRHVCDFLF